MIKAPSMDAPSRPKRRVQQTLEEQIQQLAAIVERSKHLVVYTGAGISTSAGIPDYRGPTGVWTLKGQGKRPPAVAYSQIRPSIAHRALALLLQSGHVKHVVTQNVDGLHRESGVAAEKLSELHGNARMERCVTCGREYQRDFATWSVTTAAGSSPASARAKRRRTSETNPKPGVQGDPSNGASHSGVAQPAPGAPSLYDSNKPSDATPSEFQENGFNNLAAHESRRYPPSDGRAQREPFIASAEPSVNAARPDSSQHRFSTASARRSDTAHESQSHASTVSKKPSEKAACSRKPQHQFSTAFEKPFEIAAHPDTLADRLLPLSERVSPIGNGVPAARTLNFNGDGSRTCEVPGCGGSLRHCVTLFGEPLPDCALRSAERETARADVALVLGSSLRVAPACTYPADVAVRGGHLVIVNLQPTPLDAKADLVIRTPCDQVMSLLLDRLRLGGGKHLVRELVACVCQTELPQVETRTTAVG